MESHYGQKSNFCTIYKNDFLFCMSCFKFYLSIFDWHCTYSPTLTSSFVIWPLNLQFYSPIMSAIFHFNFELHFYNPILSYYAHVLL